MIRALEADGIFLDTMDRGAAEFRWMLDAVRPGVVLEGEAALPLDRVHPPALTNKFVMTPRDAFYSDSELVDVNGSVGRVSTEIVTVYPPGIPLLVPGEEISQDALNYLQNRAGLGAIIDGLNENNSLVRVAKAS